MPQRSGRQLAFAALKRWRARREFADAVLQNILLESEAETRDRAFATELFYGVLRNLNLLDFWIEKLRARSIDANARDLLRLGIYQLFVLQTPDHAAVFETVALAHQSARGFVNATLRSALRRKSALLAVARQQPVDVRTSHPAFVVNRWNKNFGASATAALCDWNNQPPPVYARVNLLRISVEEFCARYAGCERFQIDAEFVRLVGIPRDAIRQGHCYIQDPSTAIACRLLNPRANDDVLDACAAPGGKTTLLAQLMHNRGRIIACDREPDRAALLQENLNRLGATNSAVHPHDWNSGGPLPFDTQFDRILVDAPCSNTGVMRRRVDVRWRLQPADFQRMHKTQRAILRAVVPLLKPGGVLVYSTCSIEPEENEMVVEATIAEFPFLKLAEQISLLPFRDQIDGAFAAKLLRVE